MIQTRETLKEYIDYERKLYISGGLLKEIKLWLLQDSEYLLWHFVKMLRYTEYHCNAGHRVRYFLYQRRKNKEGARLGLYIFHNCIDKGLRIYHYGSITINSHARIGKNCRLHGNNCIGNKGERTKMEAPVIGDNVIMGMGSMALGDIVLGNNVTIAANAVVNKSYDVDGVVLAGIPASIKKNSIDESGEK